MIKITIAYWLLYLITTLIVYGLIIILSYISNCRASILIRLSSFWIGVNYSKAYKRWDINLIPCITLCIEKSNGIMSNFKSI